MASVKTASYDGRYLKLDVYEESYSIANNNSVVRWTVSSEGGTDNYYNMYGCKAVVNGATVWNVGNKTWSTKVFPAKKGSETGTVTVGHDNAGNASIGFTLTGSVYKNSPKDYSGSLTLSTIPRYAAITRFDVWAESETSIACSWSSDKIINYVWFSLNNGASWSKEYSTWASSGSFSYGGLAAGTNYQCKLCIRNSESNLKTFYDGYKDCRTWYYPSMAAWPGDVTMDAGTKNITFSFNNSHNRTMTMKAYVGDTEIGTGTCTENSGTISINCDKIYETIPRATSKEITFKAYADGMGWQSASRTAYAAASYCGPSVNKDYFAYTILHNKDCLNGYNSVVQGYSYLQVRYTDANIGTAKKSASVSKREFIFGGTTQSLTNTAADFGNKQTFQYTTTTAGTVKITDSRGYTAQASISIPCVGYTKPTAILSATRSDGYGPTINLKGSVQSYSSFGGKNTVTLKWKAGSNGAEQNFTNGTATTTLASDASQTYYINATDTIGNSSNWAYSVRVENGVPILYIDKTKIGVGVNKLPTEKGLEVDGKINSTGDINGSNNISATENVRGKIRNDNSGYVTSGTAGLSSYWFKVWDATITTREYNDFSCTLQLNNRFNDKWGQIGFGIRQNGANNSGAYNFNVNLRRISGNQGLDTVRLYYNNSTGYCALWVNVEGQYGTFNYQIISKSERTSKEVDSIPGTFYSNNYSTAQSITTGDYITMTDITALTAAYPVGAIYLSWSSTSPASLFGGTWTQITDRFLYCHNSSGTNGGSNTQDHWHGMGNHTHAVPIGRHYHDAGAYYAAINHNGGNFWFWEVGGKWYWVGGKASASGATIDGWQGDAIGVGGTSEWKDLGTPKSWGPSTNATEGASDTNNMPAYTTCYAWRRTA